MNPGVRRGTHVTRGSGSGSGAEAVRLPREEECNGVRGPEPLMLHTHKRGGCPPGDRTGTRGAHQVAMTPGNAGGKARFHCRHPPGLEKRLLSTCRGHHISPGSGSSRRRRRRSLCHKSAQRPRWATDPSAPRATAKTVPLLLRSPLCLVRAVKGTPPCTARPRWAFTFAHSGFPRESSAGDAQLAGRSVKPGLPGDPVGEPFLKCAAPLGQHAGIQTECTLVPK